MKLKGNGHQHALHFTRSPVRVVSLVPSMTESLFDLGLGDSVVGITDFCIYPQDKVAQLPRLGGTKNPSIEKILSLHPDLVITNQEENPKETIQDLEEAGVKVWVTFPKTTRQAVDILWVLVGIFQSRSAAVRLETLEITLDWAESALPNQNTWSYFCPIWMNASGEDGNPGWWMTFNQDTYINDVLRIMGGRNIFSDRVRKYPLKADLGLAPPEEPGDRDIRYPRVTSQEILKGNPQVILLPDEPYPFSLADKDAMLNTFQSTTAVKQDKVFLVEGSLLMWHGTRLARTLSDLPLILGEI
jgi:iron complex transport system substrate-binding protein